MGLKLKNLNNHGKIQHLGGSSQKTNTEEGDCLKAARVNASVNNLNCHVLNFANAKGVVSKTKRFWLNLTLGSKHF